MLQDLKQRTAAHRDPKVVSRYAGHRLEASHLWEGAAASAPPKNRQKHLGKVTVSDGPSDGHDFG